MTIPAPYPKEEPAVKTLYEAKAQATGGRDGHAMTPDGALDVRLALPKELGGPGGNGTNPEQLFAAGYAACFLSALKFVGMESRVAIPETAKVVASVGIGERHNGDGFGLDVALEVHLPTLPRDMAEGLVARAHQVCPYSHATRGNIEVRITVA